MNEAPPPVAPVAVDAADRGKPAPAAPPGDPPMPAHLRRRVLDNADPEPELPAPIWRRRFMFMKWSLIFCGANVQAIVIYAMVKGVSDNPLLVQLGLGMLFTAAGIIGAYVFGATWDDKSFRDALANIRTGGRSTVPGAYSGWRR